MGGGENAQKTVDSAFEEAKYDYNQLQSWFKKFVNNAPSNVFSQVDLIDIAEDDNRLLIKPKGEGSHKTQTDLIKAALLELEIPEDVVEFTKIQRITDSTPTYNPPSTINNLGAIDRAPNAGKEYGGYRIFDSKDSDFPGMGCSIGFNVVFPDGKKTGFFTGSHCTFDANRVDSNNPTPAYLPSLTGSAANQPKFATEIMDAPSWKLSPLSSAYDTCPKDKTCRYTDAALYKHETQNLDVVGYIARPQQPNTQMLENWEGRVNVLGSYEITAIAPWPWPGQIVYKVGATTGWSGGQILSTCAIKTASNNLTYVCQMEVTEKTGLHMGAAIGDSGGAVISNIHGTTDSPKAEIIGLVSTVPAGVRTLPYRTSLGGGMQERRTARNFSFSYTGLIVGQGGWKQPITCISDGYTGKLQSEFCGSNITSLLGSGVLEPRAKNHRP
jgi:hypothetical protein